MCLFMFFLNFFSCAFSYIALFFFCFYISFLLKTLLIFILVLFRLRHFLIVFFIVFYCFHSFKLLISPVLYNFIILTFRMLPFFQLSHNSMLINIILVSSCAFFNFVLIYKFLFPFFISYCKNFTS
jgi:hypothetical protein